MEVFGEIIESDVVAPFAGAWIEIDLPMHGALVS